MEKAYLTKYDLMERYGVGMSVAERIMREIIFVNGVCADGAARLAIGKGKILPSELAYWEQNRGRVKREVDLV